MSRSTLHRKIKGISDLTPNDFIQLIRLKKAAELLREGSCRVNEICFLVGFSSSSYFSKSFKKQFGVLPKEYKNSQETDL
jgi:AraC-like DNA-binding protein